MKRKSKFITFILSFMPGLQYLYIGMATRAGIALGAVFGVAAISIFITEAMYYTPFTLVFLPVIWLIAMIDSMMIVDRINFTAKYGELDEYRYIMKSKTILGFEMEQILSIFFSIMPGAGHMYMGAMNQGVQIMASFLMLMYLSNLTGVMIFVLGGVILWFYSLFDIVHRVSGTAVYDDGEGFILFSIIKRLTSNGNSNKLVGIFFVAIGTLIIVNKVVVPEIAKFVDYGFMSTAKLVLVSLIFMVIGFRLIFKGGTNTKSLKKSEIEQ